MMSYDYRHKTRELPFIVECWMKDQPALHHFEVKKILRTWITCSCENRMKFGIGDLKIECFSTNWDQYTILEAADPEFFEKLHKLLVEACVVARAYESTKCQK